MILVPFCDNPLLSVPWGQAWRGKKRQVWGMLGLRCARTVGASAGQGAANNLRGIIGGRAKQTPTRYLGTLKYELPS